MPAGTPDRPEQRIVEAAARLGGIGAVTGWAALRMCGAAYFDGVDGPRRIPVPLVSPRQLRSTQASVASRARVGPVMSVHGVPCVDVHAALVHEMLRLDDLRAAVVALDMTIAAELTTLRRFREYAVGLRGRARAIALRAADLGDERAESPREVELRLVWMLDAGLPRPVCNPLLYGLDGGVLGRPDLLDVEAGVVGEYNGAEHRRRDRYRRDVSRQERFAAAGLECFAVVAGDSVAVQVERMRAARQRALERGRERRWTIDPPVGAWIPDVAPLEQRVTRRLRQLARPSQRGG